MLIAWQAIDAWVIARRSRIKCEYAPAEIIHVGNNGCTPLVSVYVSSLPNISSYSFDFTLQIHAAVASVQRSEIGYLNLHIITNLREADGTHKAHDIYEISLHQMAGILN